MNLKTLTQEQADIEEKRKTLKCYRRGLIGVTIGLILFRMFFAPTQDLDLGAIAVAVLWAVYFVERRSLNKETRRIAQVARAQQKAPN